MRHNRFTTPICLSFVISLAAVAPAFAAPSKATNLCDSATAARVVVATNAYRASLGLPRLQVASRLQAFATAHARDMAASAALTHSSSDGLSFADRARSSTYRFSALRENIAVEGAPFPSGLDANLMQLWRQSPPHDANLRARDISQIGVAVAAGPDGCYASMDLGHPL
jgi:uncharacterized protein YkwD